MILELHKKLISKKITSEELVIDSLDKAEKLNPILNAFITITRKKAIKESRDYDKLGKLEKEKLLIGGIPTSIKDIISTKGIKTTAGSKILENYIPVYDASTTENLLRNKSILIGKNNCDPFAMGSSGENSGFGVTLNPLDLSRVPGGTSSGSAAAVAAKIVPFSLGTDTGGSLRQPASLCGISALKTTYGRNSRYGLIAMASSLDTPGIIAHSAEDIAIVQEIIEGYDKKDSTSSKHKSYNYLKTLNNSIKGRKIGLPKEYFLDELDNDVRNSIINSAKHFERLGCKLIDISLPLTKYAVSVYYIIVTSEISSNMGKYDGIRFGKNIKNQILENFYKENRNFEEEVKRRILIGTFCLSSGYYDAYYKKAMQVRKLIKDDIIRAYNEVDVILTPTSPVTAWKIREKVNNPVEMYLADIYTVTANLCGIPSININSGYKNINTTDKDLWGKKVEKLPIGMQLMGPNFSEKTLLNLAHIYQTKIL